MTIKNGVWVLNKNNGNHKAMGNMFEVLEEKVRTISLEFKNNWKYPSEKDLNKNTIDRQMLKKLISSYKKY